jgi:hypothetical protein
MNFIVASLDDMTFGCLLAMAIVRFERGATGIQYCAGIVA